MPLQALIHASIASENWTLHFSFLILGRICGKFSYAKALLNNFQTLPVISRLSSGLRQMFLER